MPRAGWHWWNRGWHSCQPGWHLSEPGPHSWEARATIVGGGLTLVGGPADTGRNPADAAGKAAHTPSPWFFCAPRAANCALRMLRGNLFLPLQRDPLAFRGTLGAAFVGLVLQPLADGAAGRRRRQAAF